LRTGAARRGRRDVPVEPMREWWPVAVIACGLVVIGGVWFTHWVVDRLEKDRTKLHAHGTRLQVHEFKLEEHEDAIKELQGKGKE
jgi:hypothetical protein